MMVVGVSGGGSVVSVMSSLYRAIIFFMGLVLGVLGLR